MSYSQQHFACIPAAAVHSNTTLVQVRITCQFQLYKQTCEQQNECHASLLRRYREKHGNVAPNDKV